MKELEYKTHMGLALFAQGYRVQMHEDKIAKFVPDMSFAGHFVDGWVEVKYCLKVPKSLNDIEHWTKGQEQWLVEMGGAGTGHCYLLVGTPKLHVLWRWHGLSKARKLPWKDALPLAVIAAPTVPEFVTAFKRQVRLR